MWKEEVRDLLWSSNAGKAVPGKPYIVLIVQLGDDMSEVGKREDLILKVQVLHVLYWDNRWAKFCVGSPPM